MHDPSTMEPADLRAALDRCGLRTTTEAAEALGVSQPTISRWLNGKMPIPKLAELALRCMPRRRAGLKRKPKR